MSLLAVSRCRRGHTCQQDEGWEQGHEDDQDSDRDPFMWVRDMLTSSNKIPIHLLEHQNERCTNYGFDV